MCDLSPAVCVCVSECSYSALLITPWLRGMAFYCHSFTPFTWVRVANSTRAQSRGQSRGTRTLVWRDTSDNSWPELTLLALQFRQEPPFPVNKSAHLGWLVRFPLSLPSLIDRFSSLGTICLHATRPVTCPSGRPQGYLIFHCLAQSRNSSSIELSLTPLNTPPEYNKLLNNQELHKE